MWLRSDDVNVQIIVIVSRLQDKVSWLVAKEPRRNISKNHRAVVKDTLKIV